MTLMLSSAWLPSRPAATSVLAWTHVPTSRSRGTRVTRWQQRRRQWHSTRIDTSYSSSNSWPLPYHHRLQATRRQDDTESPKDRSTFLQQEICRLNGGQPLNVNSPKQVSTAVFGRPQTATKTVLQKVAHHHASSNSTASEDPDMVLSPEKQLLAQRILEYRELLQEEKKLDKQQQQSDAEQPQVPNTTTVQGSSSKATQPQKRRLRPRHETQAQQHHGQLLSHDRVVEALFASPSSQLDPYWKEPLLQLTRPTARDLLAQLNAEQCPMGFDPDATPKRRGIASAASTTTTTSTMGRKGTFLSFCRIQKELYPQCIVLVRCGDFYETYGVDAILLVEHVGLNPMAGKVKAGCPYRSIQATVDGLTQQGFSVAVYEEVGQVNSNNNKLKTRVLTQIVSPASPTYLYDNWLLAGGDSSTSSSADHHLSLDGLPPSRPCVGVIHTAAGYSIVEVSLEERSVQYSERLTAEAVACRLAAYPPADPLLYIPSSHEQDRAQQFASGPNTPASAGTVVPSFLPNLQRSTGGKEDTVMESSLGGYRVRTKILRPHLLPDPEPGVPDADRYIRAVVDTFLQLNERQHGSNEDDKELVKEDIVHGYGKSKRTTMDDFTVSMLSTTTNPLYLETARQVGLMKDTPSIPSLIHHVLDEAAPAATRRFLQRYLLIPPPPSVAQAMARVVGALMSPEHMSALPPLTVPNLGKVLSLIRAGQAGANVYGELLQSMATTMYVLEENRPLCDSDNTSLEQKLPIHALLHLCEHESGLKADLESLLERGQLAIDAIEAVVSSTYHVAESMDVSLSDQSEEEGDHVTQDPYLPFAFFERNEATWRGRVQPSVASSAYERVQQAAKQFCQAVKEDFIVGDESHKSLIVQDVFNNLIALKQKPSTVDRNDNADYYFHPRDRNGKILKNRWTTTKVQQALSDYVSACDKATDEVSSVLSNLAETLQDEGHIPALVQSAHFNLVLSTAFHHAAKASRSRWELASTVEADDDNESAHLVTLFPYWMPKSRAVANSFDLSSMILLTAPNMSGKSTLMRSTAAAALLTVCGLCAPLAAESRIPRFDTLFLRGASADVPTEDKSAFGAEMGDVAALFRCCGPRSFVFVDELGRGTSPRDGTRLAGAVLEAMAERGMRGIFATHLHDVIDLPLRCKDQIMTKRMAILHEDDDDSYEWTYQLEDGVCTDSLALVTADRFGLPEEIIRRADELALSIPVRGTPNGSDAAHSEEDASGIDDEESGDDHPSPSLSTMQRQRRNPEHEQQFQEAVALASDLTGKSPISIPPRWSPPASLSNQSCLYLLELAEDPPRYYVGETDALSQRLRQHRKKGGKKWSQSRAVALPVDNKSQARAWESLLIQKLANLGYSMESLSDGRSAREF